MNGVILQILYAFKRDMLFIGTTVVVALCAGFAYFLGSNAVVEASEAKIVYMAGFSRIAVILGFIIFVSFYIKRMMENNEIAVILSHAISRGNMLLSMFVGFAVVLCCLTVPVAVILLFLKTNLLNLAIWLLSVICEGLVMLAFTLCCSLIVKSFVLSLSSCFLMYFVGRSIGSFVAYLTLTIKPDIFSIFGSILKIVSLLVPRFDICGKSGWLIYGDFVTQDILLFLLQTIVFCIGFLCIACIDLYKKDV